MTKLTHADLIKVGTLLGYNSLTNGLCHGFSSMWAQALLAKDEECFFNRLKLIASYNPDFAALITDYEEAKKKARQLNQLTQKEQDLLEIPAFFDGITMYLRPYEHLDLFDRGYVSQNHINTIYPLIKSKMMEHSELNILLDKSHIYSKASLTAFLQDLAEQLKEADSELPILLSNAGHTVCLKYSKTKQKWFYIDTNDFSEYSDTTTYFRELETTELVSSLFESLSESSAANVLFNMKILSPTNQTQLDLSYSVTPELATTCDNRELGLLFLACQLGDLNLVQILLENPNIEINQVTSVGVTPLFIACQNGYPDVVAKVLKHPKIEINQADNDGVTPLYTASQNGQLAIIAELLKYPDILINKAINSGATPLFIACQNGHLAVTAELLKHPNILINEKTNDGATALYIACQNGHLAIVAELLKHPNILINQRINEGVTALYSACQNGHLAVVAELLKHPDILINKATNSGATPLYIACQNGHLDVVAELLKHPKIEINQAKSDGATALFIACQIGYLDVVAKVLKHPNLLINHGMTDGTTALHIACQNGHLDVVAELLKHPNIEINQADSCGVTPLHFACHNGHLDVVAKVLKNNNLLINKEMDDGSTALHIACLNGNLAVVTELLKHSKIQINQADSYDETPLYIACQKGHLAVVTELLKHPNILINQAKSDGINPLFTACLNGDLAIVELLLNTPGIDIHSREKSNHTPLLAACLSSHTQNREKLFRLLLSKGANLSDKNDQGKTALDITFEQDNPAAWAVLLKFILARSMSPSALMSSSSLEKGLCWAKAQCPEVAEYLTTYQSMGRIKFFTEPAKEPLNDESLTPRNGASSGTNLATLV